MLVAKGWVERVGIEAVSLEKTDGINKQMSKPKTEAGSPGTNPPNFVLIGLLIGERIHGQRNKRDYPIIRFSFVYV